MTSTQVKNSVDSSTSMSKQIFGLVCNLRYFLNDENLEAVLIQDIKTHKAYILDSDPEANEFDAIKIKITNLSDFKVRLQEALNHESFVNIEYQDTKIKSLVVVLNYSYSGSDGSIASACHVRPC
jgi:hypothetical protein